MYFGKNIIDKKFLDNKFQYIFQCLLATIIVFFIILILNSIFKMIIIAAFGATTFIVFTMPNINSSRPRLILGGYIVGIFSGWFGDFIFKNNGIIHIDTVLNAAVAAVTVGIAIFLMVITNTEHAPATAIALNFALEGFNLQEAAVLYIAVLLLVATKQILKKYMINLL